MKRHFKTLAILMVCMAMVMCVSCKKDDDKSGSGNTSGTIAGHEYVDLGLPSGLLWATFINMSLFDSALLRSQ